MTFIYYLAAAGVEPQKNINAVTCRLFTVPKYTLH